MYKLASVLFFLVIVQGTPSGAEGQAAPSPEFAPSMSWAAPLPQLEQRPADLVSTSATRIPFPPETIEDHVVFGVLAGAATGLAIATGWEIVVDHHDHRYDRLFFAVWTGGLGIVGGVAGLVTGLIRNR